MRASPLFLKLIKRDSDLNCSRTKILSSLLSVSSGISVFPPEVEREAITEEFEPTLKLTKYEAKFTDNVKQKIRWKDEKKRWLSIVISRRMSTGLESTICAVGEIHEMHNKKSKHDEPGRKLAK